MMLLAGRLFQLTVIQNNKWSDAATNLSIKSVYTSAPRGEKSPSVVSISSG